MYNNKIKRGVDLIFSVLMLPFTTFILSIIALFIKIEDRGPVFYTSKRLGKNKNLFNIYKVRSMKVNAEDLRNKDGSTYTGDNDPRLTRVGKVIRKLSIDELPQFFNVIKGEMSLVGPRPDTPEALDIYDKNQSQKLNVKPGITGYNQAFFRNSISQDQKFNNDVFYVNNLSFLLDLKIIFWTFLNVLLRKNINKN